MTKITEAQTLVEDKDDHIKRCPGCWRPLGSNHLEECITLREKQMAASEDMSPWLEETLKVQTGHRKQRKRRVRILCPNPPAATVPRVGGNGVGTVGDAVDSVYHAVRSKYIGQRLQVIIEGMENCEGMHFRDIPGKRIPIDGQMTFRIQERSGHVVSHMVVNFDKRTVTEVQFA